VVPEPGPIAGCSVTFTIEDVHVTDAAGSSGIEWVKFKYRIDPYVPDLTYSDPFTLTGGGPVGGGWDGYYSGTLTLDIYPGWVALPNDGGDFHIELWVKARDNAGNENVHFLGDYYIPATCDDPEPTLE
jgi:hypothetical protein